MIKLAIFASGNGTTLQEVINAIKKKQLDAEIKLVVSNNQDAYCIIRAKQANINTYILEGKTIEEQDKELLSVLSNYDIDLILLLGYLKKIGPNLIEKYTIINTHPSLLPKYGGKGMYGMNVHKAVVDNKETISGATLHYVNSNYDEGNIISQTTVNIYSTDTVEDVANKVQAAEKVQLIKELKRISKQKDLNY